MLASCGKRAALKDVLDSVKSVGDDLSPLRTWLAEVDVAAVATPTVIKAFSSVTGDQIEMLEQQGVPGWTGSSDLPALKLYQQVLTAAGDELHLAAIGVRADEAGTVRVTTRLRLTPGGQWATTAGRIEGPEQTVVDRPARRAVRRGRGDSVQRAAAESGAVGSSAMTGRKLNPAWPSFRPTAGQMGRHLRSADGSAGERPDSGSEPQARRAALGQRGDDHQGRRHEEIFRPRSRS